MQRMTLTTGLLVLLGAAAGCGDPPRAVIRDTLSTMNEVADCLLEITDQDSAKDVLKTQIEPLKKKWENVKKRQEEFGKFDTDKKKEVNDALTAEDFRAESKAVGKRLKQEKERLERLGLTAAAKVTEEFKPSGGYFAIVKKDWLDDPINLLKQTIKGR